MTTQPKAPRASQSSPDDVDDDLPKKPQVRYRVGAKCWFIDTNAKWYLCVVTGRDPKPRERIRIKPETGWDAEHVVEWPYGSELEFPTKRTNRLFMHLRPLKARNP